MKGIILSGGSGTRLLPMTKVTSKQLLPVYDRPMIYYPLQTLLDAGITDILIIVAPERAGDYLRLLGSGKQFGARFTYEIQDKPEGLAQSVIIAEDFVKNENFALILGDNIFEDNFSESIKNFKVGAKVFAKQVSDSSRFGVVEFNDKMEVQRIVEKPENPNSDYAQTGLYVYDAQAVEAAKGLKPSARGELEITDLNNWYLARQQLSVEIVQGEWLDAGTVESLYKASEMARRKRLNLK